MSSASTSSFKNNSNISLGNGRIHCRQWLPTVVQLLGSSTTIKENASITAQYLTLDL